MSDAYTINNNQEAIRELYSIRSCFKPISVQYQSLSMGIEALQMVDELPNSEVFIPKSVIKDIRAEIDKHCSDNRDRNDGLYIAMKIIDKHIGGDAE